MAIDALSFRGTKAIEFSGGGEPLLWPNFSDGVLYAKNQGLKVSLITNGLALQDIPKGTLEEIAWIRVSLQSIDHARRIMFGHIPVKTKMSASVIYSPGIDFYELHRFVEARNIITRIAMPQPAAWGTGNEARMIVSQLGHPFFFAEKPTGRPAGCYLAWIRAAIDWTGHFLPCPAVMVTDDGGKVRDEFRLCHVSDLSEWLDKNRPGDLGFRCAFCNCGKDINDLMYSIFEGVADNEFV
jgi:hypothetical protein